MMKSRERGLSSWSNATCAMPLCEALSSRRGRGPHHAHKDRVGTWDIPRLTTGHVPTWYCCRPHHESSRRAGRNTVDVDARLRAPRRSLADLRLRGDARGRDGGVREELAAGVIKRHLVGKLVDLARAIFTKLTIGVNPTSVGH